MTAAKIKKFKGWAEGMGGTVLPETSEWEFARVEHGDGTFVIYQNKKGNLSFSDSIARSAWQAFQKGGSFPLNRRHKRSKSEARVSRLLNRDGECCFYCGFPFEPDNPPTLEHLLSIKDGGNNNLANLALAHEECNREAGSLPLVEKIKLRERKRQSDEMSGLIMRKDLP